MPRHPGHSALTGANTGLGFLLTNGQNTGRSDIIVLSIVALLGKTSGWLLQIGECRLLRWTDTYGKEEDNAASDTSCVLERS